MDFFWSLDFEYNTMNETIPENTDALDVYSDYNYTYDYEDNLDWLPLNELIPCVTFYVIIGLLGISGNSLVITLILAFPKMRNITNLFLFSLASADLLLVLICVPIKVNFISFCFIWVLKLLYEIEKKKNDGNIISTLILYRRSGNYSALEMLAVLCMMNIRQKWKHKNFYLCKWYCC